MLAGNIVNAQETEEEQDSVKTGISFGKLVMPNPASIVSKYTYDPVLDRYVYTEKIDGFNINYPIILTPKEFQKLVLKEQSKGYYKKMADALSGKKDGSEENQKNLLPDFYVDSKWFSTIFGSNKISVIPQGSVEIDLEVLYSKQENPLLSPQNQSSFNFDFDQRISLSLLGKVGTRLQVTANYDTESTFDFQRLIKLEFDPTAPAEDPNDKINNAIGQGLEFVGEAQDFINSDTKSVSGNDDSIIKKIELGNVSMPLNSSLITGAQSLFGVKTELQFGKTTITAVFSEQQSQARSVVAQGGGTLEEFEFFGRNYDENRHYFLAHYFRDHYDESLSQYPYINARGLQITRVEVWVTNRNNQTNNVRNVVAFQDLGESNLENIGLGGTLPVLDPNELPKNESNGLNPTNIGGGGSVLNNGIRDITNVQGGVNISVQEGFDFGRLESAQKLQEGVDFVLHKELGYISLSQRLLNDEVLAVAFQYTINGEVFQVGEFANQGIDATVVDSGNTEEVINNQSLVLKMLKSAVTAVDRPIWNLMMKNIYATGAFQLNPDDFRLNIFYTEASPLNYITPVEGTSFPPFNNPTSIGQPIETEIQETPLLRLFSLDQLNSNNDPQELGDGFFDYVEGVTVLSQNGMLVFTKVEPFGRYLFDVLDDDGNPNNNESDYESGNFNPNQEKYVYDVLYNNTKTAALDEAEKNKFQIKGRYKGSATGGGISIGAFNVPRGSVKVTANGQVLVEGIDYIVNYTAGRVEILDEALKASNTPIKITVEDNAVFGQQTRRFTGINVEHQFNENFLIGATYLNLNERPITQKANFDSEPINNTILGFNGNYSTEVPFLTGLVNKLPNIDTDIPSNLSVRGEFAVLLPGAPKGTDFNGKATAYIDDFEGTQGAISLLSPQSWTLASRPLELPNNIPGNNNRGIENGFGRAFLNWYTIDPIFYSNQRPDGITDDDISDLNIRRVFINEIFPAIDIVQGENTVQNTLDLVYYPNERGPYNFDPSAVNGVVSPNDSWAGITREITTTNFEQTNVEYIEFWIQDPFLDNLSGTGGKLTINLGNISEDILSDGKKIYENGLPENGDITVLNPTEFGSVVPENQSLIYTFGTTGAERANQDVGYDGYDDQEELAVFGNFGDDPSNDNYTYYLNTTGDVFERYKMYNGVEGNTPDTFSDTNRGASTEPDVEDVNRDNTLNTIDSYFEYDININPTDLNLNNELINDIRTVGVTLPNGSLRDVTWYQFRIPINEPTREIGGISDIRSIRFARLYLSEFTEKTVLRFASLDLVRSDWRRYTLDLDNNPSNNSINAQFNVAVVGEQENSNNYVSPPGVVREELNNNNNIIRQNERALVLQTCGLEPTDSRGVFKNISLDMRQYERMQMFLHAQPLNNEFLDDGDLIAFIRMGNDFTDNFYQIEIPLENNELVNSGSSAETVWSSNNEIDVALSALQQIKAEFISNPPISGEPLFFNLEGDNLGENPVSENSLLEIGQRRIGIKGNPNLGDIRVLMVGVKNPSLRDNVCGEIWYNELRMSGLDNEGGWAAVLNVDTNLADFADISATGRQSTIGFGGIEQGPNERSREDVQQYDVVTNIQLGQLLPKKWGVHIPFNYAQGEELVTPEYDQFYKDLTLESRLDAAESSDERDQIETQSESYTKRRSINFIGVRKQKIGESKSRIYDIENFTFNYSNTKVEHRDFEIERSLDQSVRIGATYNYSFTPLKIEPFKKNDSLFRGKYWKILKDFNFNLLPSSFSVSSDINRQFNSQKFREIDLGVGNIGVEELFRRNYTFDFQYAINYNLTDALSLNFSAANTNIVRNYFIDDRINGRQDPTLDVWDGFFDFGDPNYQTQQLQINYELPLYKIPVFKFLKANYSYNGTFQWQKGSDINEAFRPVNDGPTFNLGHSIQNSNVHNVNSTLNMKELYKTVGLVKRKRTDRIKVKKKSNQKNKSNTKRVTKPRGKLKFKDKAFNTFVDVVTMIKRVQIGYTENNGTFLPGYLPTPGFVGTLRPTVGYTFGLQNDIRQLAAERGYLTTFPEFSQQYTTNQNTTLDYSVNLQPLNGLKIDLTGNRIYSENNSETFRANDTDGDGFSDVYEQLINNSFGNFSISTALVKTAFNGSDENNSKSFDDFRSNRLIIADRLARRYYGTNNFGRDVDGFPLGFGRSSQQVLLPAFLAAYQGSDANDISTRALRDFPIPNWDLKYTGLMKLKWFKKRFKRFSIRHGYRSKYTINQFRNNLDLDVDLLNPGSSFSQQDGSIFDESGDIKSETLYSNINLEEQFSPLISIDLEMKNSIKLLGEVRKDRLLSLSFDNNLLTEVQGNEYVLGLGYRIKDLKIRSKLAGPKQIIKSDLNMRADVSVRNNKTIIRYLDIENNQITAGQTIWGVKYTADYAFSKNLTALFYFDYTFSDFEISTSFPQTSLRSGITLRYNFGN